MNSFAYAATQDALPGELASVASLSRLGILAASIAHEVNQPLTGIITNASTCLRMLAADPPNIAGALETAQRTIRDGHRATDVVHRLRSLFSAQDAPTEMVDINEVAVEAAGLMFIEFERDHVVLQTELAHNLSSISGDRIQLQQVILNLLKNALDAMREVSGRTKQLTLRTQGVQGYSVTLSVEDIGTGIDPDAAECLFDPFFTTKTTGMGIGLSVSRAIIESHHGHLWAARNDGPGSTFSFSIPCGTQSFMESIHPSFATTAADGV